MSARLPPLCTRPASPPHCSLTAASRRGRSQNWRRTQRKVSVVPTVLVAHPSADVYGSDLQLLESIAGLEEAGWATVLCVPERGPLTDATRTPVKILRTPVLR